MTAIEKKPRIAGVAGTIAFWALFLLLSTIFSLFARKPVYKTVQIRLDSPQTQTQQARAAAAPKATESVAQSAPSAPPPPAPAQTASKPASQTATQPPAQSTAKPAQSTTKPAQSTTKTAPSAKPAAKPAAQPKPQTAKPASQPQKTAPAPVLQKSVEELMAEQVANRPKKQLSQADIDALFSDADENTSATTTNTARQTQAVQNALSGSAASANTSTNTAASATTAKNSTSTAASSGTSDALSKIAATQYTKVSGNGVSSTVTAETGNAADGTAIKMADGATRTLWNPKKPEIDLTDVSSLIDSDKKLQIQFSITPAGDVLSISITPAASVPEAVRRKIESQISTWKFTKADTTNTARLPYTITIQGQ